MATNIQPEERKVSVTINVRVGSLTKEQAQDLEDRVRDVADDYPNSDVSATRGAERPNIR